jgi:hypothetical protein
MRGVVVSLMCSCGAVPCTFPYRVKQTSIRKTGLFDVAKGTHMWAQK